MTALTLRSFFVVKTEEDVKFTSNGQTVCHRKRNCISCAKNYESVLSAVRWKTGTALTLENPSSMRQHREKMNVNAVVRIPLNSNRKQARLPGCAFFCRSNV